MNWRRETPRVHYQPHTQFFFFFFFFFVFFLGFTYRIGHDTPSRFPSATRWTLLPVSEPPEHAAGSEEMSSLALVRSVTPLMLRDAIAGSEGAFRERFAHGS